MSQMFFSFSIESLKGNKWSFTVEYVVDDIDGLVYRMQGKCEEDGRTMLFTFNTRDLKGVLNRIENILEYEKIVVDE